MDKSGNVDRYPIGRLVMDARKCADVLGIVVKEVEGPGCKQYLVKAFDGRIRGPYLNYELIDVETNVAIKT
jgi:hypothetical protein